MDHPEMKNTVFGEVFAELLEARGLRVTPFSVGKLVEDAGLDGWAFINRMASADSRSLMHLNLQLAEELGLTPQERTDLAHAFVYEKRQEREAGDRSAE